MRGTGMFGMAYGAVVCVADLVDCIPARELRGRIGEHEFWGEFGDGDGGLGRFAWKVANVRVIEPYYVRGQQGFFELDVPGFEGAAAAQGNLSLFEGG
jgi:hypothetical protein